MSFLGLEGLHVFITGAAGGIGGAAAKEFLGIFALPSFMINNNTYILQNKAAK